MTSYSAYLKSVCEDITNKFKLNEQGKHVALIFKDEEHNQIKDWAILDENNTIVKTHKDIKDLTKDCMKNFNKNDYEAFINQKKQWFEKAFHYLVDKVVDGDPTVELVNAEFHHDEILLCYEDEYKRMHFTTVNTDDFLSYDM